MKYFIVANSFAAPFFSDTSHDYQEGNTPEDAMEKYRKRYSHPCGLYAANLYENADAYHQSKSALLKWITPKAQRADKKQASA